MRLALINFLKFLLGVEDPPCPTCANHPESITKPAHDGQLGTYAKAEGIRTTHYESAQIGKADNATGFDQQPNRPRNVYRTMDEHDAYHHDGVQRVLSLDDHFEPTMPKE